MGHHLQSERSHVGDPRDERLLAKSSAHSETVREAFAAKLPEFRIGIRDAESVGRYPYTCSHIEPEDGLAVAVRVTGRAHALE